MEVLEKLIKQAHMTCKKRKQALLYFKVIIDEYYIDLQISTKDDICNDLKDTLEYWKNKFEKLISFLHNKLYSWYDKDDKL